MPNSLKCKIKHLCHNRTITESECDRILKALEQEPKTDTWSIKDVADTLSKHGLITEQESCDDCISRQAVNEIINDIRDCISVEGYWAILERMKKLPSVTPQKIGHWKSEHTGYYRDNYNCSKCGFTKLFVYNERYNYCPNCGAKMAEPKESEE